MLVRMAIDWLFADVAIDTAAGTYRRVASRFLQTLESTPWTVANQSLTHGLLDNATFGFG